MKKLLFIFFSLSTAIVMAADDESHTNDTLNPHVDNTILRPHQDVDLAWAAASKATTAQASTQVQRSVKFSACLEGSVAAYPRQIRRPIRTPGNQKILLILFSQALHFCKLHPVKYMNNVDDIIDRMLQIKQQRIRDKRNFDTYDTSKKYRSAKAAMEYKLSLVLNSKDSGAHNTESALYLCIKSAYSGNSSAQQKLPEIEFNHAMTLKHSNPDFAAALLKLAEKSGYPR